MNQRRALILCNGEPPSRQYLRRLVSQADYFVAADGGANTARSLGVRPRVIIGDLDSAAPATLRHYRSSLILKIRRQDNTDLEKALDFVLAQGIRRITVTGISGRRIDFTFANLTVLWQYARRADLEIASDGWRAFPVLSSFVGCAPRGTTVSIVPFGPCHGVTLRGLRYPLRNASLRIGEIGVSNVVSRSPFSVRVRRGHLMVFVLDRNDRKGKRR